jgi:hypothetical protein
LLGEIVASRPNYTTAFPRGKLERPLTDLETAVLAELRRMARENQEDARSATPMGLVRAGLGDTFKDVYRALVHLERRRLVEKTSTGRARARWVAAT